VRFIFLQEIQTKLTQNPLSGIFTQKIT